MNAVEIEEALSTLAAQPFDAEAFPYAFLEAFGNKATTIKRLREGNTNKSDVPGGVLQRRNIHLAVCVPGAVGATLKALRASPETAKAKVKFVLATDGDTLEAEDLASGETIAEAFARFVDHFGFFLPLAGITTVKEIKDNPIDIKATGRLNKLYLELLKHNPEWAEAERRHAMNHFMARLIFCFFAEDTDIFNAAGLFTQTMDEMSAADGSNVHAVMETLFRAMDVKPAARATANLPAWAAQFPYVNGHLFSGSTEVPHFSKVARSYLIRAGELDWKAINPDIFGSMIQAVADDAERGALGMHYTSVPNILKVLQPLFLDDLEAQLEAAGDSAVKLLNLRKRMAHIRVFDPACGSGNFLVIAYKRMRAIEATINRRRGEAERKSDIPLTNFRGIEIRDFAAEIARLALVIAEYQCDVLYRGQREALKAVLPLKQDNWITCGNALQLDWLAICPPTGTGVRVVSDDLLETPIDQAEIDFENEGGETYICGNPPYRGSKWQTAEQKADLANAWAKHPKLARTTDFVTGWFARFFDYAQQVPNAVAGFVATNSVCQGQMASEVWPVAFRRGCEIRFARTSFKWSNLAAHNAGVTVVILGLGMESPASKHLYVDGLVRDCSVIGPYLLPDNNAVVQKASMPIGEQATMQFGNHPYYGSALIFSVDAARRMVRAAPGAARFIRPLYGSKELIDAAPRACLWIDAADEQKALAIPPIAARIKEVAKKRTAVKKDAAALELAKTPYRFRDIALAHGHQLVVPRVSSESREYLPVALLDSNCIVQDRAFALYDAPIWNLALIASRLHWVWIGTVCVRMRTDFSYSNTLGWNTFPVPLLTEQMQADLTRCAEDILLAREHYFPATIADMYDPERMDAEFPEVRRAHARNDEVLERIYIGRLFKNDTERLEKLFDLYTQMTAAKPGRPKTRHRRIVAEGSP